MTQGMDVSRLIFHATSNRTYAELGKATGMNQGTLRKLAESEYTPGARILARFIRGFSKIDRESLAECLNDQLFEGTGLRLVPSDCHRPG